MSCVTCTIVTRRPSDVTMDAEHDVLEVGAGESVDRGERLVQQQELRPRDERSRDRDALLHSAGELPRVLVCNAVKSHLLEDRLGSLLLPGSRQPLASQGKHHVPDHRQPREERAAVVLEDERHLGRRPNDGPAVEEHGALARRGQPAQKTKQGRLAAARGADESEQLAVRDVERDVGQGRGAVRRRSACPSPETRSTGSPMPRSRRQRPRSPTAP